MAAPAPAPQLEPGIGRRVRVAVSLALAMALFATFLGRRAHPNAEDREHDMLLARQMRHEGLLTDGSRSPLFPALLMTVEGRDEGYYGRAQVLATLIGAVALAVLLLVGGHVFGAGVALAAALLHGEDWSLQTAQIRPEPLAALLTILCVAVLARRRLSERPLWSVAAAGGLAGLAWMAKGSGTLTWIAIGLYLIVDERSRRVRSLAAWIGGIAVAASPLWIDNLVRHGRPLWNVNSEHLFWEDHWVAEQWRWSTATAGTWWREHGLSGSLHRLGWGLLHVSGGGVRSWMNLFLVAAASLPFLRRRRPIAREDPRREWVRLSVVLSLFWIPAFAWYALIGNSRRYLFPLAAVVVPAMCWILATWGSELMPRVVGAAGAGLRRIAGVLAFPGVPVALLAAAVVFHGIQRQDAAPWTPARPFDEATQAAIETLRRPEWERTKLLAGPGATTPAPWAVYPNVEFVYIPDFFSLPDEVAREEATRWIRQNADAVLLNADLVKTRASTIGTWARLDPVTGLDVQPPPWAHVLWSSPGPRVDYMLLRVDPIERSVR